MASRFADTCSTARPHSTGSIIVSPYSHSAEPAGACAPRSASASASPAVPELPMYRSSSIAPSGQRWWSVASPSIPITSFDGA